jgi:hypothetical protein
VYLTMKYYVIIKANTKIEWEHVPVILVTWEAEAGRSCKPGVQGQPEQHSNSMSQK